MKKGVRGPGGVGEEVRLCPPALRLELQPSHPPEARSGGGVQSPLAEGDEGMGVSRRYPALGQA